jgi:hypothetical protein
VDEQAREQISLIFTEIESGYATHRRALAEAIIRTRGPILELGMGDSSTHSLGEVARQFPRQVFSFDTAPAWVDRFKHLRSERHFIASLTSWDDCPVETQFWGVALVDHAPAERRVDEIRRLAFRCAVLVVHDTEDPAYGYEPLLSTFPYRLEDRRYPQWTTVLSHYLDVSAWGPVA